MRGLRRETSRRDLWIFAYGSLMWNPGFDFEEARPATLRGYHRRLCIWSTTYRGTQEKPGLVLGLDAGGSCKGMAFRTTGLRRRETIAYLFERELDDCVYEPRLLPLETGAGPARALCFVADRHQGLYTGRLPVQEMVAAVRLGRGRRGTARDYLAGALDRLGELGIDEPRLRRIVELADATGEPAQAKAGPDLRSGPARAVRRR